MISKLIFRQAAAAVMLAALGFGSTVQAKPFDIVSMFQQQEQKHPLPPVHWIRSRKIDVQHLDIDLRFDWDKEQAIGSEVVTFAPFTGTDNFQLDAAAMTIDGVSLVGGGTLKFTYDEKKDDDNLSVTLDRVYKSGEVVKVKIDYKTNYVNKADKDTAIGGFGRGLRFIKPTADDPNKPRQIWSQGETEFNRYWFPSYDSPNDFRTTELRATVQKPFFVVSNGKLVSTKDNPDGTRTFDWKMDIPYSNYLTSIVVTETTSVEQKFENIPVYNYGYPNETKEVATTTKNLPATIKFFSEITGVKYPYPKYSQAFVEDFGGGMENISATTQTEGMIHDERELLDSDSESLQSHELAHQWFGDYVTCGDWGQSWLNESFATYMQAMWDEKFKGHDEFLISDIRSNQQQTIGTWNSGNRRPIVTKYYANKDAMFDIYAYPGGGSVLHMLRKHLGDQLFFKSLNKYLTDNAHQAVSTENLRMAVEETTGQSMDWFFDQWLYRMGHPVFDVTQSYDNGKITLNVKQTQKIDLNDEYPQTAYFQGYVEIEVDGKVTRVWLEPKAENVFTLDSPAKPRIVNFDYEGTWLKELKFEKSIDDLLYQMTNDKDVIGRRWAMQQLVERAKTNSNKDALTAALVTSAEKDHFWRLRWIALSQLSDIVAPRTSPSGQEVLPAKLDVNLEAVVLRLTKDPQSLIRAEALALLGATKDAKHVPLYLTALNDRSYAVIQRAAQALARTNDPRAFDALSKLTTARSWRNRIEIAGLRGLAELGDKRAFEIGFRLANDRNMSRNMRTTALAVVGATGRGDARAFPLIFEQFKRAYDTGDMQGMSNTLYGIGKLGDPRGLEALEMWRKKVAGNANAERFAAEIERQIRANKP